VIFLKETLKKILDKLDNMDNRLGQVETKTNKIDNIETKVSNIQKDISSIEHIKGQQEENSKILRALEHKTDVHKAEMDNLIHNVAELQGGMEDIKSKLDLIDEIATRNKLDIINLRKIK